MIDLKPAGTLGRIPKGLYIAGAWCDARDGGTFAVRDPADGQVLCRVADADPVDGLRALAEADRAFRSWRRTPARERAELLRAAYDQMVARADELATLVTLEMGKPLAEARGEVLYAAEFLRWFSEEAARIAGSYLRAPDGRSRFLVSREATGPALLITPWNFPLAMVTRKLGAALAAGCTAIVKPAEQTPLAALAIAAIMDEVGAPPGVCNTITTSDPAGVVTPMLQDGRLRALSFTGSTEVGHLLYERSAAQFLRISLELGGNAPFIVCADADLDAAVEGAMVAKLRNGGEACTAANRFLVAAPVAEDFATALAERFAALTVGPGLHPDTDIGPLIDEPAREKVTTLVEGAVGAGARVLTGGRATGSAGYFYRPTVLAGVDPAAPIGHTEIFGPVAVISTFDSEATAMRLANATEHGLVAYLYTRDVDRGLALVDDLDVGMVGLNRGLVSNPAAPFGGVKHSGIGREGGTVGIDEFLEEKYVAISDGPDRA